MEKAAVVTGSSGGLGRAIALALAEDGYKVAIHFRKSKDKALKTLEEVKTKSTDSILISGDLTDERQVKKIFDGVINHWGRIDLLVNNVGDFLFKKFAETSNSEFRDIIESNIYSTLFAARAVLPIMRKQKMGNIINIGSVGAERIILREKSTPYFLAKTGVYVLTKAMAHDAAGEGIRINMISPASMKTDIFEPADFPMGRACDYEDVVKTLRFLISDDAYYINGANIEVAGAFIPGME